MTPIESNPFVTQEQTVALMAVCNLIGNDGEDLSCRYESHYLGAQCIFTENGEDVAAAIYHITDGTIQFSSLAPHDKNGYVIIPKDVGDAFPFIRCSISRGGEVIKKDFYRRFWPKHLAAWKKMVEARDAKNREMDEREANTVTLLRAIGKEADQNPHDPHTVYTNRLGAVRVEGGTERCCQPTTYNRYTISEVALLEALSSSSQTRIGDALSAVLFHDGDTILDVFVQALRCANLRSEADQLEDFIANHLAEE